MKEASGELNMTVVTIIAVGAVIGFFWLMWPTIKDTIGNSWKTNSQQCPSGKKWNEKTSMCE